LEGDSGGVVGWWVGKVSKAKKKKKLDGGGEKKKFQKYLKSRVVF